VDAARKRGGIKIVRVAWFTDCIALWQRQDEAAYLLDDAPAGPAADPLQVPVTADEVADEEGWDSGEAGGNHDLAIAAINWDDINDEVDAAMNESDDEEEEGRSEKSDRSAMSEEEWSDDASRLILSRPCFDSC
jgi:RNA polymerase II subunit A-like phosphatase